LTPLVLSPSTSLRALRYGGPPKLQRRRKDEHRARGSTGSPRAVLGTRLHTQCPDVFTTTDTIVAIATPPGRGGIGVVRISGPEAHAIARRLVTHHGDLEPRRATFTKVQSIASGFSRPSTDT